MKTIGMKLCVLEKVGRERRIQDTDYNSVISPVNLQKNLEDSHILK